VYDQFARTAVDEVAAGDICALTGLSAVSIGETICDPADVRPLPTIEVSACCAACSWSWLWGQVANFQHSAAWRLPSMP
jgi:predicted membrane GTPase involved in stress response